MLFILFSLFLTRSFLTCERSDRGFPAAGTTAEKVEESLKNA